MLPVWPSIRYRISAPAGERPSGVEGNERVCMENLRVLPSTIPDGRLGSSRSSGDNSGTLPDATRAFFVRAHYGSGHARGPDLVGRVLSLKRRPARLPPDWEEVARPASGDRLLA